MRRSAAFTVLVLAGLSLLPLAAQGVGPCEALRGRTIRWIVPHGAGGGYDTYARLIAPHWEAAVGVRVVIENVPGAGNLSGIVRIRNARPDGLTLGLVSGPGLLAGTLAGLREIPNLLTDLTLLGQVARIHHVWLTSASSPLRTLEDVRRVGAERPIVFGLRDVGASSLVDSVGGAVLLGLPFELVPGYDGSGSRLLALQRGEVDVVTLSFEAAMGSIEDGRVRPILQLFEGPMSDHRSLAGVPWLGGESGVALAWARAGGRGYERVAGQTRSLLGIMTSGRLIVAPPGMPAELSECLEERLVTVLSEADLTRQAARAGLSWEPRRSSPVRRELQLALDRADWLGPEIEAAIQAMRE